MKGTRYPWIAATLVLALAAGDALAGAREQARRLHDRIAGVPPTQTVLAQMQADIEGGNPLAAANRAMQHKAFYNVVLKNMVTPWTNEAMTRHAPLNDYTATVIGAVRDGIDFRRILWDDLLYVADGPAVSPALPAYSNDNNNHYTALEQRNLDLGNSAVLRQHAQSSFSGLPSSATAGVMTTRAAAQAFFVAGTNRAMLRFTLVNHLCRDLEQLKDNTLPPDRIRQDVSRSPGGDSRVFFGTCLACHAGMDPLAQAFAYYDWNGVEGEPGGAISWNGPGVTDPFTGTRVKQKNWINAATFPHGYITPDDRWDNYWRRGANAHLGWSGTLTGSGNGAKSLGMELAHSDAFATCQVKKVFRTVCQHEPSTPADHAAVTAITNAFRADNYNLRRAVAGAGVYCMGD